jgi:hypothetical protein
VATKFNLDRVRENFTKIVKRDLPRVLANQAQNFFAGSWRKQGFDDGGIVLWVVPQRRIPGTRAYKYPRSRDLGRRTRATLVKTGRLRRAVQNSVRKVTFEHIWLVVEVPYAAYHNKGTSKLPKREFMGDSRTLRRIQVEKIDEEVDKIWRG